jgi:putative NIF3 family GTP cyclohydrolase 1 type 2
VYGGFGKRRVVRRALDAREDLVPDAVRPAADLAVADQPLLLRAVDHERQARVGDEAAARELRPGVQ